MRVRKAVKADHEAICQLHLHAFGEEGQLVATLASALLAVQDESTHPANFSLLAEVDGEVVAHIAFSPVTMGESESWQGGILAPLGVKPAFQRRGAGSALIESGIARLKSSDVNMLFVYGDPSYYGRFGFDAEAASRYLPPYPLSFPLGWQALDLGGTAAPESPISISCVSALCDPTLW